MAAAAFADCETKKLKSRTRSVLSRKRGRRTSKILLPAGKRILRDQINQREVPRFARDDKPVLRYTYEIFLAGETRAVFLFVV